MSVIEEPIKLLALISPSTFVVDVLSDNAAQHLCRSGTVDDVRRKAEELRLAYKRRDGK